MKVLLNRSWIMVAAATLALLAAGLAMPASAGAAVDKAELCHVKGDGTYKLLRVPANAAQNHINGHADGFPGGAVPGVSHFDFGEDCLPELKVGIAFDIGGPGDNPFNDSANQGIIDAVADFRIKVLQSTVAFPPSYEEAFTELAEQDPAMVFGVGFLFQPAADAVAPLYPDTNFVVLDGVPAPQQKRARRNVQGARGILPCGGRCGADFDVGSRRLHRRGQRARSDRGVRSRFHCWCICGFTGSKRGRELPVRGARFQRVQRSGQGLPRGDNDVHRRC